MIKKYRSREIVEAVLFDGSEESIKDVEEMTNTKFNPMYEQVSVFSSDRRYIVLEHNRVITPGGSGFDDWDPEEFNEMFEEVE